MVGGGGCGGGGPLCRSCGAGGSPPLGEVGKMLSGAAVGAGAGTPAALAARAAPAPAPCPGRPRRGRVPPPLWLRLRRVGSAVSGHPPHTRTPGSEAGAPEVSGRRAPAGQTSLPDAAARRPGTLDPLGQEAPRGPRNFPERCESEGRAGQGGGTGWS